jgi:phosphoadenosine phosphosulfate reductase
MLTADQIRAANESLRERSPVEIIHWAVAQSSGRAIVSTNFRPYEAAILHAVTRVQPNIPVLWVDHGYNRPATYLQAEDLRKRLQLDIRAERRTELAPWLPFQSLDEIDAEDSQRMN